VYQLLFQAQITLLLLYSTTHLFNKKKKAAKNYDLSSLFIGIVTYRCDYFHHFLKKYPKQKSQSAPRNAA